MDDFKRRIHDGFWGSGSTGADADRKRIMARMARARLREDDRHVIAAGLRDSEEERGPIRAAKLRERAAAIRAKAEPLLDEARRLEREAWSLPGVEWEW